MPGGESTGVVRIQARGVPPLDRVSEEPGIGLIIEADVRPPWQRRTGSETEQDTVWTGHRRRSYPPGGGQNVTGQRPLDFRPEQVVGRPIGLDLPRAIDPDNAEFPGFGIIRRRQARQRDAVDCHLDDRGDPPPLQYHPDRLIMVRADRIFGGLPCHRGSGRSIRRRAGQDDR